MLFCLAICIRFPTFSCPSDLELGSVLKPVTGVVVIQRPVTDYSYVLG